MSKEPNRNVYVGHRYVPKIMGEWNKSNDYEGLSIVTHKGASYTSKKRVPVGIDILNNEFWVLTGNYDAQVEDYRQETERVSKDLTQAKIDLNGRIDNAQEYVNTNVENLTNYVNDEVARNKGYVDSEVETLTGYVNDEVARNKGYVDSEVVTLTGYVNDEVRKNKGYVDSEVDKFSKINAIDITDFGALGNAKYQDSNGDWFEDNLHSRPAFDNTDIINSLLNRDGFKHIKIPNGNYLVDPVKMIKVKSDTRIDFSEYAQFVMNNSNHDIYSMLRIENVENVVINNPKLLGDREFNKMTTEGSAHGIDMRRCKNVVINHPVTHSFFTDGFYVMGVENVDINYPLSDNNRRQGMSLISGKNFNCIDPIFKNTNGVSPEMGLDIEPNYADEVLENIYFRNITTINNASSGVGINIQSLRGGKVNIVIDGHDDYGSMNGLSFQNPRGHAEINSLIEIRNPKYINNVNRGINSVGYKANGSPLVRIIKPKIHNPNTGNYTVTQEPRGVSGIVIHDDLSTFPDGEKIGNIEIIEPTITMANNRSLERGIYLWGSKGGYENITIKNPLEIDIGNDFKNISHNDVKRSYIRVEVSKEGVKITDDNNVLSLETDSSVIFNRSRSLYSEIKVSDMDSNVNLYDFNAWDFIDEFKLIINPRNGHSVSIKLPKEKTFLNESGEIISGTYIGTLEKGILKVSKVDENIYVLHEIMGVWENVPG